MYPTIDAGIIFNTRERGSVCHPERSAAESKDPRTHRKEYAMYFVYILSNWNDSVLYIGVTSNLPRRLYEHRNHLVDGFTIQYNVYKLVYYEHTNDVYSAISREKQLKGWRRSKKDALIAKMNPEFPIVIAGNRSAARECERILEGFEVYVCPNVMPKFGTLNIEPTQSRIREIFLNRIVSAKGLSKAAELLSDIMMPTPAAVLQATKLLADGYDGELGIGELVAVDVGGATTDVYSIADGMPEHMNTVYKGLPEPYAKRTVEGDIGMRYSIGGIVDAAGIERISELSGLGKGRVTELVEDLKQNTDKVPGGDSELEALDFALASCAVKEAVTRHAGTIGETYTMMGLTYVQEGKNLTKVKQIVVTGGSLIHTKRTEQIASFAQFDAREPQSLRPKSANVWVDRTYILAAMGLLSSYYPKAALRIMKKELEYHGYSEQTNL